MLKLSLILLCNYIFFLIEFFLLNSVGSWFHPNLILLFSIFITLWLGVRWGLCSALIGGLLKDSFGIHIFGQHIFVLLSCVYLVVTIRMYFYHLGARSSRLLLISIVCAAGLIIHFIIYNIFSSLNVFVFIQQIFLPEMISTILISFYFFSFLKLCVSKLSVI